MVVDKSVQCTCDQHVYTCVYICIVVPYVARNKFAIVVSHYGPLKKKYIYIYIYIYKLNKLYKKVEKKIKKK